MTTTRTGQPRATVAGRGEAAEQIEHELCVGQQLTFGRGRHADIRFPEQTRLSRLAGSVHGLPEGVAVTNLSANHDLHVRTSSETVRLAPTRSEQPVTSVLVSSGLAIITWPGSDGSSVWIAIQSSLSANARSVRTATGAGTVHPLTLNEATKEFAVALFLCRPRLRAVPGETATPSVPELTRQILRGTNSFHLLQRLDADREARTRLTNRTHEHLKTLRDKLIQAGLAPADAALSPESIADLLVDHNVLRSQHLDLLDDEEWLTRQEQNWEK